MDPYLEHPELWPDVHHGLITAIQELLNQQIRPKYVARVEVRVYMESDDEPDPFVRVPDVNVETRSVHDWYEAQSSNGSVAIAEPEMIRSNDPIRQGRVEIQEVATRKVVTVIEILSYSNKRSGSAGRESFLKKRDEVMESPANWVEIDLLREGIPHSSKLRLKPKRRGEYHVFSSPRKLRPDGKAWPIRLEYPLPVIGIPLKHPDADTPLELHKALALAYDRAAYDATADYAKDPVPPLPPAFAKWSKKLLKQKKVR